jgi:hypothetical protein
MFIGGTERCSWLRKDGEEETEGTFMSNWLKMIGNSEHPCPEDYAMNFAFVHFRGHRPTRILPGDHLVLYACGGSHHVFALAEVESEVYDNGQQEWPFQVDIKYIIGLPVSAGVHIDDISTPQRDLLSAIRAGHSYIELTPEEYEQAVTMLQQV